MVGKRPSRHVPSKGNSAGSLRLKLRFWALPALIIASLFTGAILLQTMSHSRHEGKIGGPYTLIDHTGQPTTQARFAGRQTLIYFGYTHCLDVCPLTLATVTEALSLLKPDIIRPVPVFITLDPERDTPDVVETYIRRFSPLIVGLTGSHEAIAAVARRFHVTSNSVMTGGTGGYRLDHSSVLYLMDGHNRLVTILPAESSPRDVAGRLSRFLPKR